MCRRGGELDSKAMQAMGHFTTASISQHKNSQPFQLQVYPLETGCALCLIAAAVALFDTGAGHSVLSRDTPMKHSRCQVAF